MSSTKLNHANLTAHVAPKSVGRYSPTSITIRDGWAYSTDGRMAWRTPCDGDWHGTIEADHAKLVAAAAKKKGVVVATDDGLQVVGGAKFPHVPSEYDSPNFSEVFGPEAETRDGSSRFSVALLEKLVQAAKRSGADVVDILHNGSEMARWTARRGGGEIVGEGRIMPIAP